MREAVYNFSKGLSLGILPKTETRTMLEGLSECYNMIPTELGLVAREEVFDPMPDMVFDMQYPFPMFMELSTQALLFTKDRLYTIDKNDNLVETVEAEWTDVPQIADFGDYVVWATDQDRWVALNGVAQDSETLPKFSACMNYKQQLIIGNAQIDGLVSGENLVAWGAIGDMSWDFMYRREAGFTMIPSRGTVLGFGEVEEGIVVYMTTSVWLLRPITEPAISFSVTKISNIGACNRHSFGGDLATQVFLGTDKELYQISEGAVTKLGYRHLFSELSPLVLFDSGERHWWFSSEEKCYVMSTSGMGEASISPTALSRLIDLKGYAVVHGDRVAKVTTTPLSFQTRGIKTVMSIEADVKTKDVEVYGNVHWLVDYSQPFASSELVLLNNNGAFFPIVAGTEVMVGYACEDFTKFELSQFWVRYKHTDRTIARGTTWNVGANE